MGNLFLVKVLRFYSVRDLAYVQELGSGEKYYCHMTHEMLSYEVSFNCMCDGSVKHDVKYGSYVKPTSNIYGIVANVRFEGIDDKKCLLACLNYGDDNRLKSNVRNGEIKLASGNSSLSITKERVNLITPRLFVNGLPYDEPKLSNYYDKTEVNTIKSDTDARIEELNDKVEGLDVDALTELINSLDERINHIEEGEINLEDYDVDFTYEFGKGGVDDYITIRTFLRKV